MGLNINSNLGLDNHIFQYFQEHRASLFNRCTQLDGKISDFNNLNVFVVHRPLCLGCRLYRFVEFPLGLRPIYSSDGLLKLIFLHSRCFIVRHF